MTLVGQPGFPLQLGFAMILAMLGYHGDAGSHMHMHTEHVVASSLPGFQTARLGSRSTNVLFSHEEEATAKDMASLVDGMRVVRAALTLGAHGRTDLIGRGWHRGETESVECHVGLGLHLIGHSRRRACLRVGNLV